MVDLKFYLGTVFTTWLKLTSNKLKTEKSNIYYYILRISESADLGPGEGIPMPQRTGEERWEENTNAFFKFVWSCESETKIYSWEINLISGRSIKHWNNCTKGFELLISR